MLDKRVGVKIRVKLKRVSKKKKKKKKRECLVPQTHLYTRATNTFPSELTESLLWLKSQKTVLMVGVGICHKTRCIARCWI